MTRDPSPSVQPAGETDRVHDSRPLSVIMPVYNERTTLPEIVDRVIAAPQVGQLVIVDDGSDDGTGELVDRIAEADPRIVALHHEINRGKGAAIRTGRERIERPFVIIQDGDLEYDPAEYERMLEPLLSGRADVVYGSRFRGEVRRVLFFWHTIGNRLITLLSNACTNLNLTDVETCYKAFRSEIFRVLPLRSERFGFEPEVTARVARLGLRIYEVPISYHGRTYAEGKKINWKDGFAALWVIFREALLGAGGGADLDPGQRTLLVMQGLTRYHRFLWSRVARHAGDRVVEIGAGIGNITQFLLDRPTVWATEEDPTQLRILESRFSHRPNVEVQRLDLARDLGPGNGAGLEGEADTAVMFNVLEHIEDDAGALDVVRRVLAPGGKLLLLVPAWPALYGPLDEALEHHRRYRRGALLELLRERGYEVEECTTLNAIGALGWWINVRLLRRRRMPRIQARINDLLVPWLRLERLLRIPFGLSWMVVARRVAGDPGEQ